MKAIIPWAGALLGSAVGASLASAEPYYYPVAHVRHPVAPDACGPGFYSASPGGMVYGPNYWLRPAGEPFSFGAAFPVSQNRGPTYPTHPFVRGPRDFFMWRENLEDQMRRELRPSLVP